MPELNPSEQDARLLAQIQTDLSAATRLLRELPRGVTVFGSARTAPDDAAYQCARRLGTWLGRAGLPVLAIGGAVSTDDRYKHCHERVALLP